jgi:UDP-N-acetyl-D-mannosaminuronate dehydrogenase
MGLTYTDDTSTLRRSAMLDYASKLLASGQNVTFFEDQEIDLPPDLINRLNAAETSSENIFDVDAIILSKKMRWLEDDGIVKKMEKSNAAIFDPAGLLLKVFQEQLSSSRYFTVGQVNAR